MLTVDWLQQKVIQSSLMLGFAVAILVALIAIRDTRRRTTATILVFTLASFMLLLDNYSCLRLLMELYSVPQPVAPEMLAKLNALYQSVKWIGTTGFLLLIAGFGLTGWIHSWVTGILTSLCGVIGIVYVFAFVAMIIF